LWYKEGIRGRLDPLVGTVVTSERMSNKNSNAQKRDPGGHWESQPTGHRLAN